MNLPTILPAVLVVLAWVFSGALTFGFMKAKIGEFEGRLIALEEQLKSFVTRVEYDARHADILRQLDRIEVKLDRVAERSKQ